jgi:branched-chain amino acid transport system substrate-binding protein
MTEFSRRRFLQLTAATGGALVFGDLIDQVLGLIERSRTAVAGEPIKIGILDPLSSPYKTSSIHDIHGANVAVDLFNKKGGVLGRPVMILEEDDASNPDSAVKAVMKFIKEDRVDVLMGTFKWRLRACRECAGAEGKHTVHGDGRLSPRTDGSSL